MNRYEIQGVAQDVTDGKTVVVLEPAGQHRHSLDRVRRIIEETGSPAWIYDMRLAAGSASLTLVNGGRLLLRTMIRGVECDIVLDKTGQSDPEVLAAMVAAVGGGELLR